MAFPPNYGFNFTPTRHTKAEGVTDPVNNRQPNGFIVCITGAGKGIGRNIALAYAVAGVAGVVISSRTQSDLDDLSSELKKINPNIEILSLLCDTTKQADVDHLLEAIKAKFSRLDVMVANAGVYTKYLADGTLPVDVPSDFDFERVIDVNLIGTARAARAFVPFLLESGEAKTFIALSSASAHCESSLYGAVSYNNSKRAVCHLVESIANDHGKDGLLAYAIHPGAAITPMTQHHSQERGDFWDSIFQDDPALGGGFLTWLTQERREWLSGRYICANWDVEELEKMKDEIVQGDKLKFKMVV